MTSMMIKFQQLCAVAEAEAEALDREMEKAEGYVEWAQEAHRAYQDILHTLPQHAKALAQVLYEPPAPQVTDPFAQLFDEHELDDSYFLTEEEAMAENERQMWAYIEISEEISLRRAEAAFEQRCEDILAELLDAEEIATTFVDDAEPDWLHDSDAAFDEREERRHCK